MMYGSHISDNPAYSWLKDKLKFYRDRFALDGSSLIGRILNLFRPNEKLECLKTLNLNKNSRILDVGCGKGILLHDLRRLGFEKLYGIDPYLPTEVQESGLKISNVCLDQVTEKFDIVMFHHSFEHMADPVGTLKKVNDILEAQGVCIIRIPIVSSFAWEHYGKHWVQIDAPRHFFLYSPKSMEILSGLACFRVSSVVYDSTAFQFWGSDRLRKGLPLVLGANNRNYRDTSVFRKVLHGLKARQLNRIRRGDQAIFYLKKISA